MRPDPYSWSAHPEAAVALVALVALYVVAVRRHGAGRGRIAAFAGAVLLLAATAFSPLDALQFHVLVAHLLQNVILAEWAPALLVLAVPPALAARVASLRPFRQLTRPAVALPLWLLVYFAWHLPPAYDAALRNPSTLLHLEHATYLAAGFLLWWPALQEHPWRLSLQARATYLFAAFLFCSPLGLLLALLPDAVYASYRDGFPEWGLTALADQQIAGIVMAGAQAVVFFGAFAYFFLRFLDREEAEPTPAGR
ncbi:MAG TPA: cytochrome c oxidase assembly protein [Gaiellaceae bacterium]|nr:cytochrome c oxidase assembly protein [Gaiellaceae bacterium]